MVGITWLHLSDWHQKTPKFNREIVRDALIRDIDQRTLIDPSLEQVDFIVFSGDLAYKGDKDEYKAAEEHLLGPLLKATNLMPDRLFFVPGNHDLNRDTVVEMLPVELQKPLNSEVLVHKWLTNTGKLARVLEPFEAYREFISNYNNQSTPDYASIRNFEAGGKNISLLGLNSAWMCARNKDIYEQINDYGYLLIGEPQLYHALEKIDGADIRIVVLHHPFDWLAEFDRFRAKTRIRQKCHFILTGHEHCPEIEVMRGTLGKSVIIPGGACYNRRIAEHPRYTNAYNFVHLNPDPAHGTVYLRRWNDTNGKWREDTDSYPDGKFNFSL